MQELTKQQNVIVRLLAEGYTNLEIADELKISYKTVKNHIYILLQRIGAKNRTEAVILFYKKKIDELEEELKKAKEQTK